MKHYYNFDSVAELVADVRRPSACPDNERVFNDNVGNGWLCADRREISNVSQGLAELEKGRFDAGVARVENMSARVQAPMPVNVRRVPVRADQGDELDMQRVWNGELEQAWRAMRRGARVGPQRVLINTQVNGPASDAADALAWRGVAAIALAERLIEAGHNVTIKAHYRGEIMQSGVQRVPARINVTLLDAGETLDVHRLASGLASALLFRAGFLGHIMRRFPHKLAAGTSMSGTSTLADIQEPGFDYCTLVPRDVMDEDGARLWISEQIAALDERTLGLAA